MGVGSLPSKQRPGNDADHGFKSPSRTNQLPSANVFVHSYQVVFPERIGTDSMSTTFPSITLLPPTVTVEHA